MTTDVTEQVLMMEFRRFGAIGSVKVMWPRTDDEKARGRNCGFVSFMHRDAAEAAMIAMHDAVLCGQQLLLSWGKACDMPPSALPSVGRPNGWEAQPWHTAGVHPAVYAIPPLALKIEVSFPREARVQRVIDLLATAVTRHGHLFEQYTADREADNADFFFLAEHDSAEHIFYRWRLHALAQGDSLTRWRTTPYQLTTNGPTWTPPPMPATASAPVGHSDAGGGGLSNSRKRDGDRRHRDRDRDSSTSLSLPKQPHTLTDDEADEWQFALRALTTERASIRAAMVFALDHAEAARTVCATLVDALTQTETPIPKKLARLYLASDILHNAASRGATVYRIELQTRLHDVFLSFHTLLAATESRLAAEAFKDKVLRVLRVWHAWSVIAPSRCDEFESAFLHGAISAGTDEVEDDLDGVPLAL